MKIENIREAEVFVAECERNFAEGLDRAIDEVFSDENLRIITLSGPTCSGKTTTANRLVERINESGHKAVVLSIDDFYSNRDRSERNNTEDEAPDYDSVKTIDLDYLCEFTEKLLRGEKVNIPRYSFLEGIRVGYDEYIPEENDIYVFEGIQAVYPEVTALFGGKNRSIFISVAEDVSYNGVTLASDEVRILRRIVRDNKFRNATAEFTLHLWDGVRSNEEKNIFPNAQNCDVYINSFLEYELFIIAKYARPLLMTVPADSKYRDEADVLERKLEVFDCDFLDDRMIPKNSVFREFIG